MQYYYIKDYNNSYILITKNLEAFMQEVNNCVSNNLPSRFIFGITDISKDTNAYDAVKEQNKKESRKRLSLVKD